MNHHASARRTKIVATLGPATDAPGVLEAVLANGVDVVRLNLSHGTADDHRRRARAVRDVAGASGREVGILVDLQGAKIRIATFADGAVELAAGSEFVLDCRADAPPGDASGVGVDYAGLPGDVAVGDVLLLDDGLVALGVLDVDGPRIRCRVEVGGRLSDRKGLNRKGGGLSLGALTEKDRQDVRLAAELDADFLAVSFVRNGRDLDVARRLLEAAGSDAALVAKIERAEAIDALDGIFDAAEAVMVARGDLGVEIGYAELPGLQKRIIREAVGHNRVVITASQMLQSMVDAPIPTRAEVLDVANAVIDGTDAVMLSAESAVGAHPEDAVKAMRDICIGAEHQFKPSEDLDTPAHELARSDQAVALAAMLLARRLQVAAIVALTESGATAQWLSRYRFAVPIYALSASARARHQMLLMRDVQPVAFDFRDADVSRTSAAAVRRLFELGKLAEGDRIILTHGDHAERGGYTNTLKLLRVGPGGGVEGLRDL